MTHCWTTTTTFPVLEQNLTYLLPLGNAFIKSITQDQNSRMLLTTQRNYAHSLKSIWPWRWWNTKCQSSAQGRYSWNVIKTFSFRRNSSQEKTEGMPNAHGKSLEVKYEDIYNPILYRKAISPQLKSQGRPMGLGQGLTQNNRSKHSLSIITSNNSCTQVTLPLDIQHWEMSWDTQVTH
jgi:hypothetical protein